MKLQEEIKKNIEDEENKKDGEDEEEEKEEEGNVFADLKKYNSSSKRTSELKKRITKSDIVCDEANKYIKRGKFSDNKSWMKPKESVKTQGPALGVGWTGRILKINRINIDV